MADERPDPAGAAARSMTQLAQQMREMADRMLTGGGLPGWPLAGPSTAAGATRTDEPAAPRAEGSGTRSPAVPGLPAIPAMPSLPGLPTTPMTMSARQLQAVVDDIAARRAQVQALVAQLEVFDEQLGTLETSLHPLLQWLRTWADMEGAVTDFWTQKPPRS
jgi:hypothetical protein